MITSVHSISQFSIEAIDDRDFVAFVVAAQKDELEWSYSNGIKKQWLFSRIGKYHFLKDIYKYLMELGFYFFQRFFYSSTYIVGIENLEKEQ